MNLKLAGEEYSKGGEQMQRKKEGGKARAAGLALPLVNANVINTELLREDAPTRNCERPSLFSEPPFYFFVRYLTFLFSSLDAALYLLDNIKVVLHVFQGTVIRNPLE